MCTTHYFGYDQLFAQRSTRYMWYDRLKSPTTLRLDYWRLLGLYFPDYLYDQRVTCTFRQDHSHDPTPFILDSPKCHIRVYWACFFDSRRETLQLRGAYFWIQEENIDLGEGHIVWNWSFYVLYGSLDVDWIIPIELRLHVCHLHDLEVRNICCH